MWWGELFLWHVPPPNRLRAFALSSSTPPQGGSELLSHRTRKYDKSRNRSFINNPVKGGRGGCLYPVKGVFQQLRINPSAFPRTTETTRYPPPPLRGRRPSLSAGRRGPASCRAGFSRGTRGGTSRGRGSPGSARTCP